MRKKIRILVTGSSGMAGGNILDALGERGYELLNPRHGELDLLDDGQVDSWLAANKPDMIIHCAGKVGGIQANIENPVDFFARNMRMGLNIILGAKNTGVKKMINLGSSCMYPANRAEPLKEEMILSGSLEPTNEGYALAKCASARLCQYISAQYPGFSYKTVIPCNLYGKYDKFDAKNAHMIPAIIAKMDKAMRGDADNVEIWGDGSARREFMFAGDLADFIALAVENFANLPELVNVGTGIDYTVDEYYEAAARVMGYKGGFCHNPEKPGGMRRKLLDVSRQTRFGFRPRHSLEEGIRKTYEWYKSIQACQSQLG